MSNTIQFKRGAGVGGTLLAGEPAFDVTDGKLYVGDGTSNIRIGGTITTAPILSFTTPVNEGSTGNVITISNYDADATYTLNTDVGTVNYTSGSTATFTAKEVTDGNDDIGVITCSATKAGELRSEVASYGMTVTYVPVVADTAYQVVDFTGQASLNDGFDLI